MLGIKELINRYRHNRGFGVQSPYAYHFVMSVIAEKHSFYAYPAINSAAARCGYKAARARILFRIANYARPHNIMMYEPCKAAVCAISMARPSVPLSVFYATDVSSGRIVEAGQTFGLFYVGETSACALRVVEQALVCAASDSVIIIDGIHRSRETEDWWQKIKQNSTVAVTFDLYSMGILFFDKSYKKQHYTLKK